MRPDHWHRRQATFVVPWGISRIAAAAVLFAALSAQAQTYSLRLEPIQYEAMPSAGFPGGEAPVDLHTNTSWYDKWTKVDLPFTFRFYGVPYTSMYVHSAGVITFGEPPPTLNDSTKPVAIPNPAAPNNMIAAWWWRLLCNSSPNLGIVRYQVVGTAPHRKVVVDWPNCRAWSVTSTKFKFQIWLSEDSDDVEVRYGTDVGDDSSAGSNKVFAAVGLENADGTDGTAFCDDLCETADFPEGTRIVYSPGPQARVVDLTGPDEGFAGLPFPIRYRLVNPGSKPAEGFTVQYWVSPDPEISTRAISMGYANQTWTLEPRGSAEVFAEPRLPITLEEGEYYLIVEADPHHVVPISERRSTIGVLGPFRIGLRAANLEVSWVTAPAHARPGAQIRVQWRVANTGNLAAGQIPYRVMLAPAGVWTPVLPSAAEGVIDYLGLEAVEYLETEVLVPPDAQPGIYRVAVEANPWNDLFEHERRDNVALSAELLVSDDRLVVLTRELPRASLGGHYEFLLRAAGGDGYYRWRVADGSFLPPGLSLRHEYSQDGDTMVAFLSGVPEKTGEFSFSLAVDSAGISVEHDYVLHVDAGSTGLIVTTEHLATGAFGFPYEDRLMAIGGTPPYTWELAKGALPVGLTLRSDGVLEGRPEQDGTFSFTVRVRDKAGLQGAAEFSLVVASPSSLTCVTRQVGPLTFGEHVEIPVHAAGGRRTDSGTYVWSSVDTTWLAKEIGEVTEFHREPPPGLQITDDGVILGKPTAFGSFLWTVNVKDASGGPGVDCPIRLDVPRDRGLTVVTRRLPTAVAGRPYRATLEAIGGDGTLKWSEFGGSSVLERQLQLEFDTAGNLVGTPPLSVLEGEDAREFAVTVRVKDQHNRIGVGVVSLTLKAPETKGGEAAKEEGGCQATGGAPLSWIASLLALGWLARRRP